MNIIKKYNSINLVIRIVCGLVIGAILGVAIKNLPIIPLLGELFVGALKAIAPVLVFVLVIAALAQGNNNLDKRFGIVIVLYLVSTFLSSLSAVIVSFIFPQKVKLAEVIKDDNVPSSVTDVLKGLLLNMVSNPVGSLYEARYIGILFWAIMIGLATKKIGSDITKKMMEDLSNIVSLIIRWIINLAPFGIMGLVYTNVSTNGLSIFTDYGKLLLLIVGCVLFVVLVVDPLLVAIFLRTNPYPLIYICIKESGITAFFTRSSAANIPINMQLCENLGMEKEMYAVSIPLGATINMAGAAISIAVMSLAAANTVDVQVSFVTAMIVMFICTLAACGASGVASGSLFMIPMICSILGVNDDVAMQVVGIGFIIGVIQDSFETALNSSSDVIFSATAEFYKWKKDGKSLPTFLGGKTVVPISHKKNTTSDDNEKDTLDANELPIVAPKEDNNSCTIRIRNPSEDEKSIDEILLDKSMTDKNQ